MFTKEQYENLIENSDVFNISVSENEYRYKKEIRKLTNHLWEYCQNIFEFEEYGVEFVEVINDAVKSYNKDLGRFIPYFLSAFYKREKSALGKHKLDKIRGGIRIPQKIDKIIRSYMKYCKIYNKDIYDDNAQTEFSKIFKIEKEVIQKILKINKDCVVENEWIEGDEGQEVSIFEKISSCDNLDDNLIDTENFLEQLNFIDSVYKNLQNRENQKKILSILLTKSIAEEFGVSFYKELKNVKFDFINIPILEKFITGSTITNKEIAKMFNVTEQSLSRTYNNFKKLVREKMKKRL